MGNVMVEVLKQSLWIQGYSFSLRRQLATLLNIFEMLRLKEVKTNERKKMRSGSRIDNTTITPSLT